MKFYKIKAKANKEIIINAIVLVIALFLLILLDLIIYSLLGGLLYPIILMLPIIISIVMLYRSILLSIKPLIILTEASIKYYNIFGYTVCFWSQFDFIKYSRDNKIIGLIQNDGRIFAKLDISSISTDQQELIIKELENYKNIKY